MKFQIHPHTIAAIKSVLPLESIVKEYLTPARNTSTGFVARCPFHNEKTASFTVHARGKLAGTFKCFGCSAGGDLFTFLQNIEGWTFHQTLKELASRAGIEIDGRRTSRSEQTAETTYYQMFPWWVERRRALARRLLDRELSGGPPSTADDWQWCCTLGRLLRHEWTMEEFRCMVTDEDRKAWLYETRWNEEFAKTWMALSAIPADA